VPPLQGATEQEITVPMAVSPAKVTRKTWPAHVATVRFGSIVLKNSFFGVSEKILALSEVRVGYRYGGLRKFTSGFIKTIQNQALHAVLHGFSKLIGSRQKFGALEI